MSAEYKDRSVKRSMVELSERRTIRLPDLLSRKRSAEKSTIDYIRRFCEKEHLTHGTWIFHGDCFLLKKGD